MTSGAPPCATAQWTMGATRVTSLGQPVILQQHVDLLPTGTPLLIATTQTRVSAM